jgi:hypothetical protein
LLFDQHVADPAKLRDAQGLSQGKPSRQFHEAGRYQIRDSLPIFHTVSISNDDATHEDPIKTQENS